MPKAARMNDTISGTFTDEHNNHYDSEGSPIHTGGQLTGIIKNGCSPNVFINGIRAAVIGSTTDDNDACCSYGGITQHSTITGGSSRVFINGKRAARVGDSLSLHCSGSATISSGSPNVNIS